MFKNDPIRNDLHIDLSDNNFRVDERGDLFERYIGSAGADKVSELSLTPRIIGV